MYNRRSEEVETGCGTGAIILLAVCLIIIACALLGLIPMPPPG